MKLRSMDIMGRVDQLLYLTRYWLLGHRTSRWALMLHKMWRPDDHDCHHDHPWSFWTLILWGGYVEEVTHLQYTEVRFNRPGMLLYRRAEHTHRIAALPNGHCWTLVLRFKRRRGWGFWSTKARGLWVPWVSFFKGQDRGILWCGDDE